MTQLELTEVAHFPVHYFLENFAIRSDGSMLVTTVNQKELWYVPPFREGSLVAPSVVHTFTYPLMGIAEIAPDEFCVCVCDVYDTHVSSLQRFSMAGWEVGTPIGRTLVATFDQSARGLNGMCLVTPGTLLIADCFAGLVWRVDLPTDGGTSQARVWLQHESMAYDPKSKLQPPQPGINGIRFAASTHHVYYTSTQLRLFMRVAVDPATGDPVGEPERVSGGRWADDFCLDEDNGVAYVTTHRENTVDRVRLDPKGDGPEREVVAGDPEDTVLMGPSSAAWGRLPGEAGRIMYLTTDGGTTGVPADGIVRTAKILRAEVS